MRDWLAVPGPDPNGYVFLGRGERGGYNPLPPSTITYAHTFTCAPGLDGLMFVYYPGEIDDNGYVIPSGVEEQLTYRYDPMRLPLVQ